MPNKLTQDSNWVVCINHEMQTFTVYPTPMVDDSVPTEKAAESKKVFCSTVPGTKPKKIVVKENEDTGLRYIEDVAIFWQKGKK